MLIKRIEIKNFRQFKDEQSVDFCTDPVKNVTVVMGDNGAGKTTLAQAFTWCLYGKVNFKRVELINREVRDSLIGNDKANVIVRIFILYKERNYRITRVQKCYAKSVRGVDEVFSVEERKTNGDWVAYNPTQAYYIVNEMLPESLASFFFFDGEHINQMSKELLERRKSEHFRSAVRGLSGLNATHEAIEHFGNEGRKNSVIGAFARQIDTFGNRRLEILAGQSDEWNEKKEQAEKRLSEIVPEIERFSSDISENNRKLGEMTAAIKSRDLYEKLGNKNVQLRKSMEDIKKSLFKFFSTNFCEYIQALYAFDVDEILQETKKVDEGIPDITAQTLEFLLKRGKCVCGAELTSDEKKKACLQELIMDLPPHSLNIAIGNFKKEMCSVTRHGNQFFDGIIDKIKNIEALRGEIDSNDNQRSMIEDAIADQDEVKEINHKIAIAKQQNQKYTEEKIKCQVALNLAETKLKGIKAEREALLANDERNRKNRIFLLYAERVAQDLKDIYQKKEEEVRSDLEKNINKIFEDIYDGGIHISVDRDYNITTTVNKSEFLQDGSDIDQNTAQSYAIIFAFISGIIELSKKKRNGSKVDGEIEDDVYPLVMDAPLSSFDTRRIRQICEELPKIAEQIVIFIKDTDGDVAEKYLGDRIGSRWKMKAERPTSTRIERRD